MKLSCCWKLLPLAFVFAATALFHWLCFLMFLVIYPNFNAFGSLLFGGWIYPSLCAASFHSLQGEDTHLPLESTANLCRSASEYSLSLFFSKVSPDRNHLLPFCCWLSPTRSRFSVVRSKVSSLRSNSPPLRSNFRPPEIASNLRNKSSKLPGQSSYWRTF